MLNEHIKGISAEGQEKIRGLNALNFYKIKSG